MYKGFNLGLSDVDLSEFTSKGRVMHANNKSLVQRKLDSFKDKNGNLLASEIIAGWFPPIEANVFLSHSHKDEEHVIGLSGWLRQELGLTSFIDSCIWGYSDELLKMIDDEYCYKKSSQTYSYEKRNRSTSHVHMMLSTALMKMINSCECIIFVNTPNSISPKEYIQEEQEATDSPWIYSEIAMTSLIQKRSPDEHRGVMVKASMESMPIRESFTVKYDVDLMHLIPLGFDDLNNWAAKNKTGVEALDALYKLKADDHGR